MSRLNRIAVFSLGVLLAAGTQAATCTSTGSGNWGTVATWSCGAVPVAGDDIVIANGHTVSVNVAAVGRDLTINNGNANSGVVISGANSLTLSRDVTVNANTNGITKLLDTGGGTLSVGRDLTLASTGNTRIARLAIGTGTATITRNLTANNQPNREQVVFSGAGTLRIGGNFSSGGTLTAGTGTVVFNGTGNQSMGAYSYYNLTVAKAAGTATLAGNTTILGIFTDNGGFNGLTGSRTVTFSGAVAQSIAGTSASTSFYRLTLNNGTGLGLGHNVTASNRLTLTSGRITTNAFVLSVGISNASPGTIQNANATRFVVGNLRMWVQTTAGNRTVSFPVGTVGPTAYAPVTLRFNRVTTGNYAQVTTTAGDHPQIATSGINPARSVNRYWTATNMGVAYNTASANNRMIFNFVAADRDGGSNPLLYIARRYAAGAWSATAAAPTRTATSITLPAYMGFGEFAVGEPGAVVIPGGFDGLEPGAAFVPLNVAGNRNPIRTKVSGTAMGIDIAALDATKAAILTTFTGDVKVELLDASNNSGATDPNGCKPTWTPIPGFVPVTLTFAVADSGRKNIALTESNAWRDVRLRVSYPAVGAPSVIGCSTDNFAIRPSFLGVLVTDADWQTAGTGRTLNNTVFPGGTVHKAGQPFTVTVTGYNGAATPAITTNYDGTPTGGVTGYVLPALGACPTCALSAGIFAGAGGTVVSNTATYSEVGVIQLQIADDTFAAVDAADGSTVAERTAYSANATVGRFVPDHFTLTAGAVGAACTTGTPQFTYMSQPFSSLNATVQARNAAGAATVNYHSLYFAPANLAAVAWQAENLDNGVDLSPRLSVTAPTPLWANGVYSVGTTAATFNRASPDNPDGPFDALQLGLRVTDPDNVTLDTLNMNAATAGACAPCTAQAVGGATSVRFGRLRLSNALGSELRPLPIPVMAEYWNGSGFAINFADYLLATPCTGLAAGMITVTGVPPSPVTPVATISGSLGSPNYLTLAAPGAQGNADVSVNLSAMPWLRGRWDDTANPDGNPNTMYDDAPKVRARFGVHRDSLIYRRENTR